MFDDRISEGLKKLDLFKDLTLDQLEIVSEQVKMLIVEPETVIFNQGDAGNAVYFIVEGNLDVILRSDWGEDVTLANLGPGTSFGEMSIIDGLPRSAGVVAKAKASIIRLGKDRFEHILRYHPDIGVIILRWLARFMSDHLRRTNETLSDFLEQR